MARAVISCFSQSWTMQSRQDVYTFAKHLAWSSICSYIYMYRDITCTYKSSDSRSRAPIDTCTQTPAGLVFSNEIFIGVSLKGIMQIGQHRCHTHGHTNHHSLNSRWKSYNIQDMHSIASPIMIQYKHIEHHRLPMGNQSLLWAICQWL